MSKQLTGALFVDIQGDNKNLKKSLNDSKQSVSGFGAAVTQSLLLIQHLPQFWVLVVRSRHPMVCIRSWPKRDNNSIG
jgi:hypothetical protein